VCVTVTLCPIPYPRPRPALLWARTAAGKDGEAVEEGRGADRGSYPGEPLDSEDGDLVMDCTPRVRHV